MKKLIFIILFLVSVIYAKRNEYNCPSLYTTYKIHYNNLYLYNYRNAHPNAQDLNKRLEDVYKKYCIEQLGKAPEKNSYLVQESEDKTEFLERQRRTLGVACEQIKQGLEIYYQSEYCEIINNFNSNLDQANQSAPIAIQTSKVMPISPAIKYKNTPQLKMYNLHIYGITNFTIFRNKEEIIMVESEIGNYAIPIKEIVKAERINFTTALSQKLNNLIH